MKPAIYVDVDVDDEVNGNVNLNASNNNLITNLNANTNQKQNLYGSNMENGEVDVKDVNIEFKEEVELGKLKKKPIKRKSMENRNTPSRRSISNVRNKEKSKEKSKHQNNDNDHDQDQNKE